MSEGNSTGENQDVKKYKVLMVHNYYQIPGGEDTVVANERKLLEDNGHEVVLYTRNNSELKEMGTIRKLMIPITTVFNPRTYREVRKLIKEKQIDIVHVHNTLNLVSSAVYYAALSMKIPVVQTVHNFRLLCPGATFYRDGHICEDCVEHGLRCAVKHSCYRGSRLQTLACVISTKIHRMTGVYGKINYICLTEFNKEKLLSLKQIRQEKVFIKPNFTFSVDAEKKMAEFYLFIGRIEEIKGVPVVLEAFAHMPDKKLVLAGTGTELEQFKKEVEEKGLTNIEFKGFLMKEEINSLLAKAKALIVASQWYETFGMVVAEAFAAHTPVIVGDIGNIGSLVVDGFDGVKFQYDSSEALIEAVDRFEMMDTSQMGENAYKKFCREFAQAENYEMLKSTYTQISSGGGSEAVSSLGATGFKDIHAVRQNKFVYVGRLDQLKGLELLFRAWKQIEQTGHPYRLVVCGNGPMEDWCREFIQENDLKQIEMKGLVPNEEAREITAASVALILPTQCYEGFPMTLVEAYSVGTPMIVSNLGNAGSIVEDDITGFKFQHDSTESLIAAIEKMGASNRRVMAENVKRKYISEYTEDANYRRILSIYQTVKNRSLYG